MLPDIVQQYRENQIHGVKGPPNSTGIDQAQDVASNFMTMHSGVKKIQAESIDCTNEILRASMNEFFTEFATEFPQCTLSSSFKKKCIHGNEVIVHCAQSGNMSGPKLRKAFVTCGQVVPINQTAPYQFPGYARTTVDVRKVFKRCSVTISDEEVENFELNLPELVASVHSNGRCCNELMDTLNIMKTEGNQNREELVFIDCYYYFIIVTNIYDNNILYFYNINN